LSVPKENGSTLLSYYPVQYGLPRTYGVSPDGFRPPCQKQRKAQAKQYGPTLYFTNNCSFNYVNQLAHVKELFSLSQNVFIGRVGRSHSDLLLRIYGVGLTRRSVSYILTTFPTLENATQLELELLELNVDLKKIASNEVNRFMDHLLSTFCRAV
jgi:hypothetical protein